ncbi:hypothetical protein [Sporosarcina sp. YIM B06819]|uniref:hypothetical protein n=1 Tax=Sporosarcina sp. YIM B06819 TaxID=3081769 RepID=UPI00298CC0B7|nr:hypothetical protein [Sporosarcina sp. YIM B06819]
MIVKNGPGVFSIIDYNTMRFFFGYSSENMIDVVRRNFWEVENQQHRSNELNQAYLQSHEIGYDSLLEFPKSTSKGFIREKRNQLARALETYTDEYGFNAFSYSLVPNKRDGNRGIYAIIIHQKRSYRRKFYIGLTDDINKRMESHQYDLKRGNHRNQRLQDDFNNGLLFTYTPLVTFTEHEMTYDQLKDLEVQFIYIFRTYLPKYGYNINANGVFFHQHQ